MKSLRYFLLATLAVALPAHAATELYIAARGVNLDARTWSGRNAVDIARDNGNTQLAERLSRSLPAKR